MTSIQIPIASEISYLLNFFLNHIFFLGAITILTSRIAGLLNYQKVFDGEIVNLRVFDFPIIGNGIVMKPGIMRYSIIATRVLALITVCISTYGIQGRTLPHMLTLSIPVGVPMTLQDTPYSTVVQPYFQCSDRVEEGVLYFGSFLNNRCYPTVRDYVVVKSISLTPTTFSHNLTNCSKINNTEYSIISCKDVDLSCTPSPSTNSPSETQSCAAVVYESNSSKFCPSVDLQTNFSQQAMLNMNCRDIQALRNDIQAWTTVYRKSTTDLLNSLFIAAYGATERKELVLPGKNHAVTIVSLWWFIPILVEILLFFSLFIWYGVLTFTSQKGLANNERSLLKMLKKTNGQDSLDDDDEQGAALEWA